MNSGSARTLLGYAIILPLAVVVGWMLSSPLERTSVAVVGGVLFTLLLPLILKYHYPVLVFSWSAMLVLFFIPGGPMFWTLMVGINICMAVLGWILQRRPIFTHVPMITFSLLALTAVILITAKLRGGFGFRALGSDTYGAKGYFYLLCGILGYFALASQIIPTERIQRYLKLFLLSSTTALISNVLYYVPALWYFYLIFPASFAGGQAQADYLGTAARFGGFATAGLGLSLYLMARFGVTGLFSAQRWWRFPLFLLVLFVTALGGYRSNLLLLAFVFMALFVFEGAWKTMLLPTFVGIALIGFGGLVLFVDKLPVSVQRSLSVLPLKVDPVAKLDAQASLDWRLQMWRTLLPELPNYVWLGKGYTFNPTDMFLTQESIRRGFEPNYAAAMATGDYHNGPLSVYVPFGLPGVLAFLLFAGAAIRGLYLNYKYGDESLRSINRFLLAYFVARLVFFSTLFGAISSDIAQFTGIIGLSVALNGGVRRRATVPALAVARPPSFGLPAPRTA